MEYQKITITIESRIENVSLVGMVIGKLCSSIPLSKMDAYLIEVCAVEAVTNSIIHAYGNAPDNHVEIVFSFDTAGITLEVCDTGTSMDPKILDEIKASSLEVSPDDIASISEGGRGLMIIKEVMDFVEYKNEKGKNRMTMRKQIDCRKTNDLFV